MLLSILLFPLLGFLSGSLLGRFLGRTVFFLNTFFIFLSFSLSILLFIDILTNGNTYIVKLTDWVSSGFLLVNWSFCFDSLTSIMLIIITMISTLVHLFSTEYMEYDPHYPRFMSYLSLFTFFMIILVTSNNFLQMFVGWEGVGLSSYLLINFWFTRIQANKAAIKAMLVNRVGDFFILLAIFFIYYNCRSLEYDVVFSLTPLLLNTKIMLLNYQVNILDIICILLFLGAMGKSAQLGLHTWLPDAMEGPTPVSALIHAATMVTAGIFLITRCSYFFEYSQIGLNFIIIIGSLTAFFASTVGLFQNDIKRIIAYSTCSQLGYMIFACGLSNYETAMFHLSNHAFFKALLFLAAGSVIHAVSDEQDIRKLGGLQKLLPFSYAILFIGSITLMGFPFLTGFYSKDVILEAAFAKYTNLGHFSFVLGTLTAFCSSFYSIRLLYLTFLSEPNGNRSLITNAHESSWRIRLPLVILCFFSIFIGYLTQEIFIGFGTNFWQSSIFILPKNYIISDIEFVSFFFKLLPLVFASLGALLAFFIYSFKLEQLYFLKNLAGFRKIYIFLNKKWFFDRLYNSLISQKVLNLSLNFSYKNLDRGLLEIVGPTGISRLITFFIKECNYLLKATTISSYFNQIVIFIIIFFLFTR